MKPQVTPFYHAPTGTYSYVVRDPETLAAAIIDPVLDYDHSAGRTDFRSADQLVDHVQREGATLNWILETHAHADHLTAAPYLCTRLGGKVAIGKGITVVQGRFRKVFNLGELPADGSQFDHLFDDDETFRIGSLPARAIPTPGHTSDSMSYLIGEALFVGDSLFMPDAGTARCDFPGGDAELLYTSIQRLYKLPDETRVFVCHDYGPGGREPRCETSIGEQRRTNIHVRDGTAVEDFVRMRTNRDRTLGMPALIIPSIQVNIQAGHFPPREDNGVSYLKVPVNAL